MTPASESEDLMHAQLAALAHASVLQLREAIHRVTRLHMQTANPRNEQDLLSGVDVCDSSWAEWEETVIDVRHRHA